MVRSSGPERPGNSSGDVVAGRAASHSRRVRRMSGWSGMSRLRYPLPTTASGGSNRPRHGGGNVPARCRAKGARFLGLARRSGLPRPTREPSPVAPCSFSLGNGSPGGARRWADLKGRSEPGPSLAARDSVGVKTQHRRRRCTASGVRCLLGVRSPGRSVPHGLARPYPHRAWRKATTTSNGGSRSTYRLTLRSTGDDCSVAPRPSVARAVTM